MGGKARPAHRFDGDPLTPERGGRVRLLVPHLYSWRSAKWVSGIHMSLGNHIYGDPSREQRYMGD